MNTQFSHVCGVSYQWHQQGCVGKSGETSVELEVQGHKMTLDFHVMNMSRANVVLG